MKLNSTTFDLVTQAKHPWGGVEPLGVDLEVSARSLCNAFQRQSRGPVIPLWDLPVQEASVYYEAVEEALESLPAKLLRARAQVQS